MTNLSAFARVLDEGLTSRALTLDRVVGHLARHGQHVSASTLSLWRRARTRPAADRSDKLLAALEQVLRLEEGALRQALTKPDVGTPDWWAQRMSLADLDPVQQALHQFRTAIGLDQDDDLHRISVHIRVDVGTDREVERIVHSGVLRPVREGPQRLLVYHCSDMRTPEGEPILFQLSRSIGGRAVHQVEFLEIGVSAAVVELDQPVSPGETTSLVVEWERRQDGPGADPEGDFFEVRTPWPIGQLIVEACFAGEAPATAQAWQLSELDEHTPLVDTPAQPLPPTHCLQAHADHVVGGGVRLHWTWGPDDG